MKQTADIQKWIPVLKAEFERQKQLWLNAPPVVHQQIIREIQQDHFARFLEKGLPSDKDPHWKFTQINRLFKTLFLPVVSDKKISSSFSDESDLFSFPETYKIHFHNGVLVENSLNNLPAGIKFFTWNNLSPGCPVYHWITQKALKRTGDGLYYLAGALPLNGFILFASSLDSAEGSHVTPLLHIHFSFDKMFFAGEKKISRDSKELLNISSMMGNLKNFIFLEEGAKLNLVESVSIQNNSVNTQKQPLESKILINSTVDVNLSAGSSLKWLFMDQGSPASVYLNQVHCSMEESAFMNRLSLSLGSRLSRDAVEVHQLGEKAHSTLLNLALLKEEGVRDQRVYIYHTKKGGYCRQFSRGILNDRAKNIFHGKIHVSSESAQTDCAQSAKNLFLSSTADSYTQPEMEIHCGEVKARHGATAGQLDKDEIFYLLSRGIEEQQVFELLIMAYVKDVFNQFPEKTLTENLIKKIQNNKAFYLNL